MNSIPRNRSIGLIITCGNKCLVTLNILHSASLPQLRHIHLIRSTRYKYKTPSDIRLYSIYPHASPNHIPQHALPLQPQHSHLTQAQNCPHAKNKASKDTTSATQESLRNRRSLHQPGLAPRRRAQPEEGAKAGAQGTVRKEEAHGGDG